MKLASYNDGSRDGQLVVVSRDLSVAHYASHVAHTLQQVLDDWRFMSEPLQQLYDQLNQGRVKHAFPFEAEQCLAPLPRAVCCAGQGAYASVSALKQVLDAHAGHAQSSVGGEVLHRASGAPLLGACAPWVLQGVHDRFECEAGLAVVCDDLGAGSTPEQALQAVRLLALVCEGAQVHPDSGELQHMGTAFSPVMVTPDELGSAWREGRVHLPLRLSLNDKKVGLCDAGAGMTQSFAQLLAQGCAHYPLRAGLIQCSGLVGPALPQQVQTLDELRHWRAPQWQDLWAQGHACVRTRRWLECLLDGQAHTTFLQPGDTLQVEMKNAQGQSVLGRLTQRIITRHALNPATLHHVSI